MDQAGCGIDGENTKILRQGLEVFASGKTFGFHAPSYQSQSGRGSEAGNGNANPTIEQVKAEIERKSRQGGGWDRKHHRTKSHPSSRRITRRISCKGQ